MMTLRRAVAICTGLLIGLLAYPVYAAETGHYVNGIEGIKAATVPPPGLYNRLYTQYYTADELMDADGDDTNLGFDLNVFALANRLIWITEYKVLGADYGASIIIPFIYTDVEISKTRLSDDRFGLGDPFIEPLILSWHGQHYDASFGAGFYVPVGAYATDEPASAGRDFWTLMFTGGVTYYFDMDRTWTASVLSRYQIHSEKEETEVEPGNDFSFEWGIGKSIAQNLDVGIAGYCHWQVTDDDGKDLTWDREAHDQVYALGPEIAGLIPDYKLGLSFRMLFEFGAQDRSEGIVSTLTMTYSF